MSDGLVNRLQWAATLGDLTTTSARNLMEEAAVRIVELEAENAGLSANQCLHDIHGDESGNLYCPRIAELEAALEDMAKHVWRGDWDKLKPETRALLDEKK